MILKILFLGKSSLRTEDLCLMSLKATLNVWWDECSKSRCLCLKELSKEWAILLSIIVISPKWLLIRSILSFATMKVSRHFSFCVCIETLMLRPKSLYKLKWWLLHLAVLVLQIAAAGEMFFFSLPQERAVCR